MARSDFSEVGGCEEWIGEPKQNRTHEVIL
jgi:hypothetical protein